MAWTRSLPPQPLARDFRSIIAPVVAWFESPLARDFCSVVAQVVAWFENARRMGSCVSGSAARSRQTIRLDPLATAKMILV